MMKKVVLIGLVVFLAASTVLASKEPTPAAQPAVATQEEISSLRAEISELKAAIAGLQATQPKKKLSIGVLPIDKAGWIPQAGDSFRQVIVSALREAGIFAVESLDDETLRWVQRQNQLVREGWIDPRSAPPRGELQGVTHFLLGTVTSYREEERADEGAVILGILRVKVGGGYRVKYGRLVVDFRLINAESGVVLDAFRTEAEVKQKDYGGVVFEGGGVYGRRQMRSMPELAARSVAEEAAERIVKLVQPQVATTTIATTATSNKK